MGNEKNDRLIPKLHWLILKLLAVLPPNTTSHCLPSDYEELENAV